MSFSSDIKKELARIEENGCCAVAQAYGMAEFGHSFSKRSVSLQTENESVAKRYEALISEVCGVKPQFSVGTGMYTVSMPTEKDTLAVLERFGHSGEVTLRINRANLDCDACAAAFLRGAFLACGAVTNPQVDYHLEFSVPFLHVSNDLVALLKEQGLNAKTVQRKGSYIVYFKESEQIEDCLTLMGAMSATLELMNVKLIKNIRNNVNRAANCESANLDKTVAASFAQIESIKKLEKHGVLETLPEELRLLCTLRVQNPEYSLRELGALLEPPLSRSGVNHRLQRILKLAEEWEG